LTKKLNNAKKIKNIKNNKNKELKIFKVKGKANLINKRIDKMK